MTQETQTAVLYQPRWVGWGGRRERGSKGRGYMYMYGLFMLTFDKKKIKRKVNDGIGVRLALISVRQHCSFNHKKSYLFFIAYMVIHTFLLIS